ncbi:MAG: LPS export ABC transporter periplasmic protein LptC [Campylobacteraceae bacterium]|nr:LPS export ABC transporter periplasmic protein LptC [Campylobacteraceae bacterium]
MAVRTLLAFMGAFMSILFFLLVQEPYALNFKSFDNSIAHIEMHIVQDYEITTKGVSSIFHAKRAMRFQDRDEFYEVDGIFKKDAFVNTLQANKAIMKGEDIELVGDVYYVRSDDNTFKSEQANYNKTTKILSGDTFFVATFGKHESEGEGFEYQTEEGILNAWHVNARLETEK